ncbi:hypothetical protein L227DRAFT_500506 [Lentinus tigrinus ALCF2SS1-6]|uniref:Uncharacterized protein n=1 Tax=Lentinus tigrinus ALCF2SS1-6 TaxID=1328759 RepID=A0A5C2SCA3_9APHY|nr:hypothetical protein L227DRAFT_500506 [Lentinus tigrinus ALCF2SS1-6]
MPLNNDTAALIGFACEAIGWGLYAVLFISSLVLILRRLRTHATNVPIVFFMCALFVLCTTHFALEFNHFYVVLGSTGVDGFANETKPLIGADILVSLCDLFGDFILLYRCWIVWERNYWVIILPALTAVAGFACIMEVAHIVVTLDHTAPVAPTALVPLGIAGYSLPLATNVIATTLIVSKLWWILRKAAQETLTGPFGAGRTIKNAVTIVIESGLLYLVAQLVLVVLFSLGHPAQAIIVPTTVQIYGIAPTLIIIRVALGISSEHTVRQIPTTVVSDWQVNVPRRPSLPAMRSGITEDTCEVDGQSAEMKAFSTSQVDFVGRAGV